MPNRNFFAFGEDHRRILEHIFDHHPCRVFELYSPFDAELLEFRSLANIEQRFQITDWSAGAHETLHLQLYPPNALGKIVIQRISLDPRSCDGATYRFSCNGWGLVQLYLEIPYRGTLRPSHTNHNSEKRAIAWQSTYPELGPANAWNWTVISSFSRRLNRFIDKVAVDNVDLQPVLPGAFQFLKNPREQKYG